MRRIFYLVIRTLKHRPFRAWVMIVSLLLACATLFTATVFSRGIRATLRTTMERLGADIVAVPADAREEAQAALISGDPTVFYMPAALEDRLRATPGVRRTCAQVFLRSLNSPCCVVQVSLVGFDPERDFTITPWVLRALGAPLQNNQIIVGAKVISAVVGSPAKAIGQRLVFMGKPFTVAAILEPTGLGTDYTVFLTMETAYRMTKDSPLYPLPIDRDQISTILAGVEEGADPAAVAREIEQRIPELKVWTASQLISSYSRQLRGLVSVLALAGGVFCLLAVVLAGSLFTLSVRQRMREIGLFLAMGARRTFVFRLILLEAVCIAGTGGLLGVLTGLAATWFGRDLMTAMIGNLHTWPDSTYFFAAAGLTLLAAIVTGALGGLYPAWRISRVEPYEAIRRGE
jgi:putative ABC transport system permease protein